MIYHEDQNLLIVFICVILFITYILYKTFQKIYYSCSSSNDSE